MKMIGYTILLIFLLLFPLNINSLVNFKTACEILKLPRDCHCQRTRGVPISSLNETRLRCRQLTKLTTDYRWSIVLYDRLAFETSNDNLTLHRFAFADVRARTIRFSVDHLFLNDRAFDNAYIGQLAIMHGNNYGKINFEPNGQVFYGSTVTNIFIKSIDFQNPVSEIIFSNTKIYTFLIESSKFYGYTNKKFMIKQLNETNAKKENQYDNFLEYDLMLTTSSTYPQTSSQSSPLKIRRKKKKKLTRQILESNSDENSRQLPDQTVTMNVTSYNIPAFITIYTVLSSINTTNLTEYFFPNNIEYSQTDEIELSYNYIHTIDAYAFRHLQYFEGRLILRNNHIQYISSHAFLNLNLLNNLSLANNFIKNLDENIFIDLNQLNELDLSTNSISKLNSSIFQSLNKLQILNLNNNPIKYLDSNIFTNLTNLKEIHLQGVDLIHLIKPDYSHWIWDLANLHGNYLLNTDFDLTDVAFCLLSRFNQTFFHLPRQHSCSCNVHYLYHNPNISSIKKYHTNYLRLTPICHLNETTTLIESNEQMKSSNLTDFLLQGLENNCDYKLMFLDCDAMTTTTTTTIPTTTIPTTEITTMLETSSSLETTMYTTTEVPLPTTTQWYFKYTKPPKNPKDNIKKLFTVLGTLLAITIGAIILVILWYRLKAMFKRKQKKKKIIEQQKYLNSPLTKNPNITTTTNNDNNNINSHSTEPRYASSDMLSSIPSTQLINNNSQSQALIAPATPPTTVYKNVDALANESIHSFIDEESQQQQQQQQQEQQLQLQPEEEILPTDRTTDIQAITEC